MFLHFGLMHLAFNCIWLAMLGSKIEQQQGSIHLLLLVVACGVVSNMVQFNWSGSMYFGGMSGVIYALLGYLWVRHKLRPASHEPLPQWHYAIYGGLVVVLYDWRIGVGGGYCRGKCGPFEWINQWFCNGCNLYLFKPYKTSRLSFIEDLCSLSNF